MGRLNSGLSTYKEITLKTAVLNDYSVRKLFTGLVLAALRV